MTVFSFPLPSNFSLRSHSTVGRENPSVLPEPVKSLAITSSLLKIGPKVCYWIGKRLTMPLLMRLFFVYSVISGKFE